MTHSIRIGPDGSSVARVTIVGPGAMGCLFAGLLREAGHEVFLLDKDKARADIIVRDGVVIREAGGSRRVRVRAGTSSPEEGPSDVVLVCVKSYDTAAAVRHAAGGIGELTAVVSMQNGAGNVDAIAARVGRNATFACTTGLGATILGAGQVRLAGRGRTWIAPAREERLETACWIGAFFSRAGIETGVTDDIDGMVWSKLVINAGINPVSAVYGIPNGKVLENDEARALMRAAVTEAARVARASGARLFYRDEVEEAEAACAATSGNLSSMLQDVQRRKRTEADAIGGAVVAGAGRLGLAAPVSIDLLERVRGIENGYFSLRGGACS